MKTYIVDIDAFHSTVTHDRWNSRQESKDPITKEQLFEALSKFCQVKEFEVNTIAVEEKTDTRIELPEAF